MARMIAITLLVFVSAIGISQAQNAYCTIATCPLNTNTLCKYTSTTWGTSCVSASTPGITETEKAQIVSLHNDYRRKVAKGLETLGLSGPQPQASNMRELVWDDELALMAQTHAQQCVFQHDSCRHVNRFKVGQNIYKSMSQSSFTTSNWAAGIKKWYDEVQYMTNDYVASFSGSTPNVIGHYTQLVWATTYTVGCGVVDYSTPGSTFPYNRFYVCNYGPTGNFVGSPVYTQGAAGSACPAGTTNKDGLCA